VPNKPTATVILVPLERNRQAWECHSYRNPMGNVPWDGMRWDRHKLVWEGNGTDKYVPCTTLEIEVESWKVHN